MTTIAAHESTVTVDGVTYLIATGWKLPTLRVFEVFIADGEVLTGQGWAFTLDEAELFVELLVTAARAGTTAEVKKTWNRTLHARLVERINAGLI